MACDLNLVAIKDIPDEDPVGGHRDLRRGFDFLGNGLPKLLGHFHVVLSRVDGLIAIKKRGNAYCTPSTHLEQ